MSCQPKSETIWTLSELEITVRNLRGMALVWYFKTLKPYVFVNAVQSERKPVIFEVWMEKAFKGKS